MPSQSRYRIDRFRVSAAARGEFMERVAFIDRFLGGIDGCLSHGVYERQLESGDWAVVTVAEWRSPEVMATAQSLAATEMGRAVNAAVDTIPASRRPVVRMYLMGYPREEIAALMGWTEAKTRNLLYRGLADLRQALTARGIGPRST